MSQDPYLPPGMSNNDPIFDSAPDNWIDDKEKEDLEAIIEFVETSYEELEDRSGSKLFRAWLEVSKQLLIETQNELDDSTWDGKQ